MTRDDRPDPSRRTLTIRATLSEIDKARSFLREYLAPFPLDEEEFFKLELALVEICVNISRYAYAGEAGTIGVTLSTQPGFCIEIRDSGRPFDPRLVPPPDLDNLVASGRRGGLGVYLARSLVDEFSYKREGGENVITLSHCLTLTP
jgi:serine/threonine-protein kinase RsbW